MTRTRRSYPVKPPAPMGEIYEHKCRHCHGSGQEPDLPDLTCRECIGRGRRKWRLEECRACRGSGKTSLVFRCERCQGRGWVGLDVG